MMSFAPLWRTMKEKEITTYKLLNVYGFSHGTYDSLKQNRNVTCKVEDVIEYVEDNE